MIKNYLKTALRNLLRYKGFAIINIASLTIGIVGCLAIGLFVWDEEQFDKHIPGSENVYRIYNEQTTNSGTTYNAPVAPAYASALTRDYPEVDTACRILMSGDKFLMEAGETKAYESKGWFVESSFFKIFPLKFAAGDPNTALIMPNTVVISQDLANRYFHGENPIGKTIKINSEEFAIKGVMEKLPGHFHLDFNYLMSLPSAQLPAERMEKWTWTQFYTYIKLKPGTSIQSLQNKFQAYVKNTVYPTIDRKDFLPFFQPMRDIHLGSASFVYDNAIRGNKTYVQSLTLIAIFVLIIACFNFINLATARSLRRAKEIGVRKVLGAGRKQLVYQFVGETMLLSVLSVIIATVITVFIVPLLNEFTGKSIHFNPFTNPLLFVTILLSGIVIGILAGIYPALILSGFQPMKVLKSMRSSGKSTGGTLLRQGLVVVQFTLSVLLIVSTVIVYKQTRYMNDKDLGFNKEQVLFFGARGDVAKRIDAFKAELKRSPGIIAITAGYGLPGDQFAGDGIIVGNEKQDRSANIFLGDEEYVKTLGMRIIAGRDFSKDMPTDVKEGFIINETAVREFGFGSPEKAIGQALSWNEWSPVDSLQPVKHGKVIGVVQDFHYKSLHEKITATVIQLYPQVLSKVAIKLKTTDMKSTLAYIQSVWNTFSPEYPIDYKFMDESYGEMYKGEEKLSDLLWIFTIMAIVVGCMGLFGLSAFSAEQRVKEIGVRKVLGANVMDIAGLLSRNFILLIVIASFIAFPIAWWVMQGWLKDFPYRITISWWIFGAAFLASLLIALITVSFQSLKAAVANPIKSLRTE